MDDNWKNKTHLTANIQTKFVLKPWMEEGGGGEESGGGGGRQGGGRRRILIFI